MNFNTSGNSMLQDLGKLNIIYCLQQGPKRLKEYKYNSKDK